MGERLFSQSYRPASRRDEECTDALILRVKSEMERDLKPLVLRGFHNSYLFEREAEIVLNGVDPVRVALYAQRFGKDVELETLAGGKMVVVIAKKRALNLSFNAWLFSVSLIVLSSILIRLNEHKLAEILGLF